MAGLRERQKAARERRILKAASAKFRSHGFRSVKIEELAEMAEVSVGTVYNYYETKGDILIATVAMEVEEVITAGAPILTNPPLRFEDAILGLIYQYYDHSLKYLSKEMWRTAIAHSIEHPNTPSGRRYAEQDRRLAAQVTELIAVLQDRGQVRRNLIATDLGTLIFSALNQAFIEFVKQDELTLAQLKDQITAQIVPIAHLVSVDIATTD